jgi:hypothetical protein
MSPAPPRAAAARGLSFRRQRKTLCVVRQRQSERHQIPALAAMNQKSSVAADKICTLSRPPRGQELPVERLRK